MRAVRLRGNVQKLVRVATKEMREKSNGQKKERGFKGRERRKQP